MAQSNLSVCLIKLAKYREALSHAREALSLYRPLVAANPDRYNGELAKALNELGVAKLELGEYEDASHHLTEALSLFKVLAAENPGRYGETMAMVRGNLRENLRALGQENDMFALDPQIADPTATRTRSAT